MAESRKTAMTLANVTWKHTSPHSMPRHRRRPCKYTNEARDPQRNVCHEMILIVTPSLHRRRIDMRLLPILGVMYSMSLIDRTNLGLALVAGMQEDLGLAIGSRYTIIVMVFFVTYMYGIPIQVAFTLCTRLTCRSINQGIRDSKCESAIPQEMATTILQCLTANHPKQNLLLPKIGPANWLSFLGVSFGAILIGMGFTKSWITMAVCRALLGVLEAGFLPGTCPFACRINGELIV